MKEIKATQELPFPHTPILDQLDERGKWAATYLQLFVHYETHSGSLKLRMREKRERG